MSELEELRKFVNWIAQTSLELSAEKAKLQRDEFVAGARVLRDKYKVEATEGRRFYDNF